MGWLIPKPVRRNHATKLGSLPVLAWKEQMRERERGERAPFCTDKCTVYAFVKRESSVNNTTNTK
jgi:hypothetical protein